MKSFSSRVCARKTFTTTSILLLSAYLLYRFLFQSEKDTREGISQYEWIPSPTSITALLNDYPEMNHLSNVNRSFLEPIHIHLEFIEPMSADRYCSLCVHLKEVFGDDVVIT